MSNEMVQVFRSRQGQLLQQMKDMQEEQDRLKQGAQGLTKETMRQAAEFRKAYRDMHKESVQLENDITKLEKGQKQHTRAIKRTAEAADKATGKTKQLLDGIGKGAASAVAILTTLIELMDRAGEKKSDFATDIGSMRMELSTTLSGFGLRGKQLEQALTGIERVEGAASQRDLVDFFKSSPASSMTVNDAISSATWYSRTGGPRGMLAGPAFGQLQAQFGNRYAPEDIADMTIMANENIGQDGLTGELMKHVGPLAQEVGLPGALSLVSMFAKAKQGEALGQLTTALVSGEDLGYILDGRSEIMSGEFEKARAGVMQSIGYQDPVQTYHAIRNRFLSAAGPERYALNAIRQQGSAWKSEVGTATLKRNLEIEHLKTLADGDAQEERNRRAVDEGLLQLEVLQSRGAAEEMAAGGQMLSHDRFGSKWYRNLSGQDAAATILIDQANAAVDAPVIRLDESQVNRISGGGTAAAAENF